MHGLVQYIASQNQLRSLGSIEDGYYSDNGDRKGERYRNYLRQQRTCQTSFHVPSIKQNEWPRRVRPWPLRDPRVWAQRKLRQIVTISANAFRWKRNPLALPSTCMKHVGLAIDSTAGSPFSSRISTGPEQTTKCSGSRSDSRSIKTTAEAATTNISDSDRQTGYDNQIANHQQKRRTSKHSSHLVETFTSASSTSEGDHGLNTSGLTPTTVQESVESLVASSVPKWDENQDGESERRTQALLDYREERHEDDVSKTHEPAVGNRESQTEAEHRTQECCQSQVEATAKGVHELMLSDTNAEEDVHHGNGEDDSHKPIRPEERSVMLGSLADDNHEDQKEQNEAYIEHNENRHSAFVPPEYIILKVAGTWPMEL